MHKKCLFQIRSIKKPITFLKMVAKIVFITKYNEKLFERHYSSEKIVCKSQNGNPLPPPDKNNGSSLIEKNSVIIYLSFPKVVFSLLLQNL